jgi:hypothetical protein
LQDIQEQLQRVPSKFHDQVFEDLYEAMKQGITASTADGLVFLDSVDFSGKSCDGYSLQDLADAKKPSSKVMLTTLIVYYLQTYLDETAITPSHVYTGYRVLNSALPSDFPQNLRDVASAKYGFIRSTDGILTLTPAGRRKMESMGEEE